MNPSAILAAALVWAAVLAIGWHYLVAPFPPPARRPPATRRRRSTPPRFTPPHRDPTMTLHIRPHLLTLLGAVMALSCGATVATAQTKDQRHQAAQLAAVDSARDAAASAATLDSAAGAALSRFCGTKTSYSYTYIRAVCAYPSQAKVKRTLVSRTLARGDSIERAFAVLFVPPAPSKDSTVVVKPPTDSVPSQPPVITPEPTKPPVVVVDSTPAQPPTPAPAPSTGKVGPATIAELPRSIPPDTVAPSARQVRIAGTNLQAALDGALPGDELLAPPDAVYVCNCTLPNKGASTSWITLRTDTTLVTVNGRMTPSAAAARHLAKVLTPNNQSAIATALGAHHWRLLGIEIGGTPAADEINGILRLGDGSTAQNCTIARRARPDRRSRLCARPLQPGGASLPVAAERDVGDRRLLVLRLSLEQR
jgi:hypothetical protein